MPDLDSSAPPAVAALLASMAAAADAPAAVAAFEAGFFALPAFAAAGLLTEAADAYRLAARAHPARLLDGLARQLDAGHLPRSPASAIAALRLRLEQLDDERNPSGAATLFEAVLADLPPLDDYWIAYRMSGVYAELRQDDAAFLLASIALQMEPCSHTSLRPAVLVMARLVQRQAWSPAAALHAGWSAANPALPLLEPAQQALLAARPQPAPAAASARRRDREIVAATLRPALRLGVAGRGVPASLRPLLEPEPRPAVGVAELDDAELLVADGAVAVFAADGSAQPDLSVGRSPGLVLAALRRRRQAGEPVGEDALEAAVLIGDAFAAPNLCHFMLDQATRLAVYARAGIAPADWFVVGPDLVASFQRDIARRLGARRYVGTAGFARLRVRRLAVSSNCHHLRHSAHLGADWALAAVRDGFADVTAGVARGRRLLISRADAGRRRLVDEAAAMAALQPHGFERIVPGTMSLADQVRAFAAATHVVAAHGAALANIAFCAPGTRVLEIFPPHYGTYAYAMLAAPLRLDYAAMLGWDGTSDAAEDNDVLPAALQAGAADDRDIRVDMAALLQWLDGRTPAFVGA